MRLLVDLGGTNTRCTLAKDSGDPLRTEAYANDDFVKLEDAIAQFFESCRADGDLSDNDAVDGAFAIAAPITSDQVALTNRDWQFSRSDMEKQFGFRSLVFVNDFTANAMAIPALEEHEVQQIGGGTKHEGGAIAVIGPGTGLGVSGLLRSDNRWVPIAGEGGHVTMAACTEEGARVLRWLRQHYTHVSAEKVISGFGLANIYGAIVDNRGWDKGCLARFEHDFLERVALACD